MGIQFTPRTYQILAVDDKPENLFTLQELIKKIPNTEIIMVGSGHEALLQTLEHDFCLAIVDVQMPEMDGYELVELLRGNQKTAQVPVIFVSAIFSDATALSPVLKLILVALLSAAKSPSETTSIAPATKMASVPVPSSGA